MLEYAISFYNNYTVIFYLLLITAVVVEWPITILTLSMLAPKLEIPFLVIYVLAFSWEFFWDLLHYVIWRFFKKNILKNKSFKTLEKAEEKLKNHSLFDKLIVIKYTPPITSIWLLYLWFNKTDFKEFSKYILLISLFNWIVISFIWLNFWVFLKDNANLEYILMWIMFSLVILYLSMRVIWKTVLWRILKNK